MTCTRQGRPGLTFFSHKRCSLVASTASVEDRGGISHLAMIAIVALTYSQSVHRNLKGIRIRLGCRVSVH